MINRTKATQDKSLPPQDETIHQVGRKIRLRLVLLLLTTLLITSAIIFYSYIKRREPLPELIAPNLNINYPPHYLFSIYGTDKPVGLALSPDERKLFVSQSDGNRSILVFDREGIRINEFWHRSTIPAERAPVYLAIDHLGQVYVVDRLQHSINIFDAYGNYQGALTDATSLQTSVNQVEGGLAWKNPKQEIASSSSLADIKLKPHIPDSPLWSPLGIRMGIDGCLLITDVSPNGHSIYKIEQSSTGRSVLTGDVINQLRFGTSGDGDGELNFPNTAVSDESGRIYVSDGNNGRISVWDQHGNFEYHIGAGSDQDLIYLPRGLFIDSHQRLHVVDAVGHNILVFDISGERAKFLFSFGDIGLGDGQFNYPNDITIDQTGRIYIADRENNRVQIWSY